MSTTTYIIIMAVCLLLSAYFSATETAFSSANITRLKTRAEKGNSRAALACKLLERYDKLLSTILIGNNIVNIAMASLGTVLFVRSFGDMGATLSTVVVLGDGAVATDIEVVTYSPETTGLMVTK